MNTFLVRVSMVALVLSITMTVLSAWIRLSDAGLGCSPHPSCLTTSFRQDPSPGVSVAGDDTFRALRLTHRFVASAFGLIAVLLAVSAWWFRATGGRPALTTLILATTLVLAWVGLRTPDVLHPIVTLTNLSGGVSLAALLYAYVLGATQKLQHPVNLVVAVIVFAVIVSGAWASGNFAVAVCDGFLNCATNGNPALAFDPMRTLQSVDGVIQPGAESALILHAHHLLSMAATAGVLLVSAHAWRNGSDWLPAFYTCAALVGHVMLLGIASPESATTHNLLALVLLLALIKQSYAPAAPEGHAPPRR